MPASVSVPLPATEQDTTSVDELVQLHFAGSDQEPRASLGRLADPFEDLNLIHFLRFRKHSSGLSNKQSKRVEKLSKSYVYEPEHGKLFVVRRNSGSTVTRKLLVPPVSERPGVIQRAHLLGHFASNTTFQRVREQYWWPNLLADVQDFVDGCVPCLRAKSSHSTSSSPAQELAIPSSLFQRLHMDLVFGFPETKEGFKGIMTMIDAASKWASVYAIKTKTALETANHLFTWIADYGPPQVIVSDMGKEFINTVIASLSELVGVERSVTSPYHPQANGQAERFNQTFVEALRVHAQNDPTNWPQWIPFVLMAYRSRVTSTTGITPYAYVFGREPSSFLLSTPSTSVSSSSLSESEELANRARQLKYLVETTRPAVTLKLTGVSDQNRKVSDQRNTSLDTEPIPVGTKVWHRIGGSLIGKVMPRYVGPYTVLGTSDNMNYRLQTVGGSELKRTVRRERLKIQQGNSDIDNVDVFRVEEIVEHRTAQGKLQYRVKWYGFPLTETTWEPEESFVDLSPIDESLSTGPALGALHQQPQLSENFIDHHNETISLGLSDIAQAFVDRGEMSREGLSYTST